MGVCSHNGPVQRTKHDPTLMVVTMGPREGDRTQGLGSGLSVCTLMNHNLLIWQRTDAHLNVHNGDELTRHALRGQFSVPLAESLRQSDGCPASRHLSNCTHYHFCCKKSPTKKFNIHIGTPSNVTPEKNHF